MGRDAAKGPWLLACVLLLGNAPYAVGQSPIPRDKMTPNGATLSEEALSLWQRDIDAYRNHTKDPESVRPQAEEFLRTVLLWSLPRQRGPGLAKTVEMGKNVFSQGSKDPLVRAHYATTVCHKTPRGYNEMRTLATALDALRQSDYPPACQRPMLFALYTYGLLDPRVPQWPDRRREAIALAAAQVGDVTIGPEQQRIVLHELSPFLIIDDNNWQDSEILYESCTKQPKADPWTVTMIAGRHYRKLAWHHRGGDWSRNVTPEGGKLFQENLQKAAEHYAEAMRLHAEFPEAASDMIAVAMAGESDRTPREWFDQAVSAQIDHMPAYDALKWALRPRWGGSHEEMYQFGCECADTRRYDTNVPYMLVQIVDEIDQETGYNGEIWKRSDVYAKVKQVLEGMADDPSRADGERLYLARTGVMSLHAALAERAAQYADGRRLLDDLGDRLDREVFNRWCRHPDYVIARTYAWSGKAAAYLTEVNRLIIGREHPYSDAEIQQARSLCQQALEADDNEWSRAYCQSWHNEWDDYAAFNAGKWVEKKFDPKLLRWRIGQGVWSAENERSAVGGGREPYSFVYLCPSIVPPLPLEIEFDVKALTLPLWELNLGLFVPQQDQYGFHQFCILTPQNEACVRMQASVLKTAANLERANRVRIQLADGRAVLYVNDQLCIAHGDETFHPSAALNLGCYHALWPYMKVRISNVRIHKWDPSQEAPAEKGTPQATETPAEEGTP